MADNDNKDIPVTEQDDGSVLVNVDLPEEIEVVEEKEDKKEKKEKKDKK